MGVVENVREWTKRNSAPVTVGLVISLVGVSLVLWFTRMQGINQLWLANSPSTPLWTYLTYPWAYMPLADGLQLLCFVCLLYWMIQVGGSVERDIGSARFAGFWVAATLVPGIVMMLGAGLCHLAIGPFGHLPPLSAPWLPESALTLVWCVRNRTTNVMLFGFLPISGFWLGWGTVAATCLIFGAGAPVLGVLACVHLGVAALYALDRIPNLPYSAGATALWGRKVRVNEKEATTRGQVRYDDTYFEDVRRREKERAEQERLKKLFGDE